jgi:glycosyltransferase involved in cell wall biosynthesis
MRILLLTQVLPYPPDSGPKVKTWNVLKYLAQRHEVTLASFVRGDQSDDVGQLARYCCAVYTVPMKRGALLDGLAMARSLLSGQPWMMVRDDRAAMRQLVDRLVKEVQFDIAHADQLNMAQYAARVPGAGKILDAHNALWLLYKRLCETMGPGLRKWLLRRDWQLLKKYEGRVCREFGAVLAVSEEDKIALMEAVIDGKGPKSGSPPQITVIPIAVDTDEMSPVVRRPGADHILHIGTMYWPPNIDGILWFIREVYPSIRAKCPAVTFDVVGARPPQEIVDLAKDGTGINVTGYVADPTLYLEQAGVMVVPLRAGGGMRVKILNALTQGLPIVSTSLGCEGIAVTHGQDVMIADHPHDFAEAVLQVLDRPAFAEQLGRNGRRLAEREYDFRQACLPIEAVYKTALARSAAVKHGATS